jgi:hypothetical protein
MVKQQLEAQKAQFSNHADFITKFSSSFSQSPDHAIQQIGRMFSTLRNAGLNQEFRKTYFSQQQQRTFFDQPFKSTSLTNAAKLILNKFQNNKFKYTRKDKKRVDLILKSQSAKTTVNNLIRAIFKQGGILVKVAPERLAAQAIESDKRDSAMRIMEYAKTKKHIDEIKGIIYRDSKIIRDSNTPSRIRRQKKLEQPNLRNELVRLEQKLTTIGKPAPKSPALAVVQKPVAVTPLPLIPPMPKRPKTATPVQLPRPPIIIPDTPPPVVASIAPLSKTPQPDREKAIPASVISISSSVPSPQPIPPTPIPQDLHGRLSHMIAQVAGPIDLISPVRVGPQAIQVLTPQSRPRPKQAIHVVDEKAPEHDPEGGG